jgi:AraC-like DNA-binding protein
VSAELVTRAPRPALAGAIVGLTWYAERAPAPVTFRELPCTYVPVIIDLDDGWAIADGRRPERPAERLGSFVAGLCDGPVIVSHGGTARCLQLDLTPLAARRLLGVPMAELANRSVDLGDVVGPAAAELAERIDGAGTPERAFAIVEAAVQARLAASPMVDSGVAWSLGRIGASGGRAPVGGLAEELGWSHRRLIARFRDAVGMPPKRVGRIVRLERLLARVDAPEAPDWARAAAELGFADQAHLAREVRELTGLTPTALRAERVKSVQDAPPPDAEDGRSPHRREEER